MKQDDKDKLETFYCNAAARIVITFLIILSTFVSVHMIFELVEEYRETFICECE